MRIREDQVLGQSYTTKWGNLVTVEKKINETGLSRFIISCDVCSKDEELFPFGSLTIDIRAFRNKSCNCVCTKTGKLSHKQKSIIVNRLLSDHNLKMISLLKNDKGKWVVEYSQEGSTIIKYTLYDNLVNKRCIPLFSKTEIKDLKESLPIDADFEIKHKLTSDRKCWEYFCNVCNRDSLTKAGLCSGKFLTRLDSLKNGNIPCRCIQGYKYNNEQKVFRLKAVCENKGFVLLNVDGDNFTYECAEGHNRTVRINNFLSNTPDCKKCVDAMNNNVSGFYENRKEELDTLYFIKLSNEEEEFFKVGRTFKPSVRFKYFSAFYKVEVITTIQATHRVVFSKEQEIHKLLKDYQYLPKKYFKGSVNECFKTIADTQDNIDTVLSHVNEYLLQGLNQ